MSGASKKLGGYVSEERGSTSYHRVISYHRCETRARAGRNNIEVEGGERVVNAEKEREKGREREEILEVIYIIQWKHYLAPERART